MAASMQTHHTVSPEPDCAPFSSSVVAKVADFGLAEKMADNVTHVSNYCKVGTVQAGYMAALTM